MSNHVIPGRRLSAARLLVLFLQLAFGLLLAFGAGWALWFVLAAPAIAVFIP